ncbi:MAG: hypothetical protein LRY66_06710 [Saccharospirillaceae bacterium]|nr:hypothetical protein [Saccharospirillaceae bacterium]MCD8531043.1 hypothetical protein [Saccharospirillaceae bacterium]
MTTMTISQASELIWDLLQTLEDAYWEASNCQEKDQVFNLMQLLNAEYMELLKISVQDHHYEYEVISTGLALLQQALEDFQRVASLQTRRQSTSTRLNALLNKLSANLSSN